MTSANPKTRRQPRIQHYVRAEWYMTLPLDAENLHWGLESKENINLVHGDSLSYGHLHVFIVCAMTHLWSGGPTYE